MSSLPTRASSTPSTVSGAAPSDSSRSKRTSADSPRVRTGVLDAVLAVCLGARSTSCGAPLDRPSHGAVCRACWSALRVFVPPLCPRCGTPLPSQGPVPGSDGQGGQEAPPQDAPGCCPACPAPAAAVYAARAVGPHEGVLRDAVHALKYHGLVSVAVPIAARMRDAGRALLTGAEPWSPST